MNTNFAPDITLMAVTAHFARSMFYLLNITMLFIRDCQNFTAMDLELITKSVSFPAEIIISVQHMPA
jgi:hypothetical protein